MNAEWKPGDVVTGLLDGNEIVGIVRGGGKRMFYADSVTTDQVDLKHVRNLRPLVVIDPEDRKQVERLTRLIYPHADSVIVDDFEVALREFATPTPPKPDEPQGLGAVVEDAEGERWVNYPGMFALPWSRPDHPSCEYADIAAVRVLSAGVA